MISMWFVPHSSHIKRVALPTPQSLAKSSSKIPESLHLQLMGTDTEYHEQMLKNSGTPAQDTEKGLEELEGSGTSQEYGPQNQLSGTHGRCRDQRAYSGLI